MESPDEIVYRVFSDGGGIGDWLFVAFLLSSALAFVVVFGLLFWTILRES